jgi:hypothetical protein
LNKEPARNIPKRNSHERDRIPGARCFIDAGGKEPEMVRKRSIAPGWMLPLLLVVSMAAAGLAVVFVIALE